MFRVGQAPASRRSNATGIQIAKISRLSPNIVQLLAPEALISEHRNNFRILQESTGLPSPLI